MKHPLSLSSRRDFQRVISTGAKRQIPLGTIYVAPRSTSEAPSRLGLAIPARLGGAVIRNRMKRRLRAAFRLAGPDSGVDVVIRAGAGAVSVSFQEMEEMLAETASA